MYYSPYLSSRYTICFKVNGIYIVVLEVKPTPSCDIYTIQITSGRTNFSICSRRGLYATLAAKFGTCGCINLYLLCTRNKRTFLGGYLSLTRRQTRNIILFIVHVLDLRFWQNMYWVYILVLATPLRFRFTKSSTV